MSSDAAGAIGFDERLRIEHACLRLVLDYSHFADAKQMDVWATLFADDAELVVNGASQRGRETIRAGVGDGNASVATFHSVSNIRIDVRSPVEAEGEVWATVFVVPAKDGIGQAAELSPAVIGKYLDVYRKTPGGWRFARREFVTSMTRTAA